MVQFRVNLGRLRVSCFVFLSPQSTLSSRRSANHPAHQAVAHEHQIPSSRNTGPFIDLLLSARDPHHLFPCESASRTQLCHSPPSSTHITSQTKWEHVHQMGFLSSHKRSSAIRTTTWRMATYHDGFASLNGWRRERHMPHDL